MRHLRPYRIFLEEAEFDVQATDKPDVKGAKELLTKIRKDITDYKQKKPAIDNLFLKAKTDEDIKAQLKQIIGEKSDNQFIIDYLHVASLTRKVDMLQKDITSDKLKKDDFTQELGLSKEESVKQAVSAKITDITNRISTKTAEIASLSKEISDAKSAIDKKMIKMEKDIMDSIKKISIMP